MINRSQIKEMRINSITLKSKTNKKEVKIEIKNNKFLFSEIDDQILKKNDFLELLVEINLLPFGKKLFPEEIYIGHKESEPMETKARILDKNGNIVFLMKGKI